MSDHDTNQRNSGVMIQRLSKSFRESDSSQLTFRTSDLARLRYRCQTLFMLNLKRICSTNSVIRF
jgi:hypothetical protein